MDHDLAVQNQAAERYILGDMSEQEREAFEEHFFSCESCAIDVRATSDFADAARAIFREGRTFKKEKERRWFEWRVPSLAWGAVCALCLIVIAYQNVAVIPALRAPHSLTSGLIFDPATRSATPQLHQDEGVHFQMPWDRSVPALVELRRNSSVLSSGAVAAPAPNQPLDVFIPVKLNPGRYSVVVRALTSGAPAQQSVENQFEVIP